MNVTNSQTELTRIGESNYFTDKENVFYVVSSLYNNSGFYTELMQIDTLKVADKNTKPFERIATLISREQFLKEFENKQPIYTYYNSSLPKTIAIKIPEVTLAGFKIINQSYAEFNTQIFVKYNSINNADIQTFEYITAGYAKDKKHVYFQHHLVKKADPSTFEYIDSSYAKDKNYVFQNEKILEDANPKTFQVLSYSYQKDDNTVWAYGKPTTIDIKTFTFRPSS